MRIPPRSGAYGCDRQARDGAWIRLTRMERCDGGQTTGVPVRAGVGEGE
jgi:hypothetical protein